jgi:hypothetical protein
MPYFRASQAEKWFREYKIEAKNLKMAKKIYAKYIKTFDDEKDNISVKDPQFIEDIEGDIIWYEEEK